MVLGVLVGGKSYTLRKYLFVLLIVVGVSMFMYNPKKAAQGASGDGLGIGELLLVRITIVNHVFMCIKH